MVPYYRRREDFPLGCWWKPTWLILIFLWNWKRQFFSFVSDKIKKESKCQGTWREQVEKIANGSRRSTKEVNRCLTSCSGREKLVRNKRRPTLGLVGGGSALKPQVTASKTPSGCLPAALNIKCLLSVVKVWIAKKNPLVCLRKFLTKEKSLGVQKLEDFGFEMGKNKIRK